MQQSRPDPNLAIRPARMRDLEALVRLEESGFEVDRISRRSFRHWLGQKSGQRTSIIRVAELDGRIVGYGMLLFRKGTAMARLYSMAVAPESRGRGAGRALLDALEAEAFERDRLILRLEVSETNGEAIRLYERAGYRRFGRWPDYYDDGSVALRYEKWLRGDVEVDTSTPYYEQTTEFSCGPSCLLMALRRYNDRESEWWTRPGPQLEVRLWRESTTVFMTSGIGGCEPFGLAVAAAEYGLAPEVYISSRRSAEQLLFLDSVRSAEKQRVMALAQRDFRDRAAALGIPVHSRGLTAAGVAEQLRAGRVAIVLFSGYPMFGKKVPHWVLAHAVDEDHIIIHDPWVEAASFESQTDAANVPIPFAAYDRMSRYGTSGLRAAVVLAARFRVSRPDEVLSRDCG